jgi:DeoR family deoxyribose operon repressor
MTKSERMRTIMQALETNRALSIQELSRQLDVSPMTVRRDVAALANEDKVKVLYGSVMLHPNTPQRGNESYYSLIAAGAEHPEEKRRIGQLAASLIEAEDSLIIDCGSTTEYLAKYLPDNIKYTVLCYSLNVVAECVRRKNCRSVFSGGVFHENTLMFESTEGLETIRHFRATKAFISASGVNAQFGVTCSNSYERETKKVMIQSSMKKILVVDSSKFGVIRSDYFANLADFDEIVTDSGITNEYIDIIKSLDIPLRIA